MFDGLVDDASGQRRSGAADAQEARPGPAVRPGPRPKASPARAARQSRAVEPSPAPTDRPARASSEPELPDDVTAELAQAVGRERAKVLADRMASAARAYARDRYPEASRISRLLADQVPESAAVRELHGLVCYRLGRWREAIRNLEAARTLAGDDPTQLPVLMDCHRAQGHHRRVAELWDVLREASPDADILAEGRLVMAATLAERGDLDRAVELLAAAGAARNRRHPAERHVRQWYVLADLSERAGDLPRARELFARVADADPELADAGERLIALGRARRRR